MSALYQDHPVPSTERGAARCTDAIVALHTDDNNLGVRRYEFAKLRSCERVVLPLVDDILVGERGEDQLPAGCVWLVWLAGLAVVSYMNDTRLYFLGARFLKDTLDVSTDSVCCRHATGRGVSQQVNLDIYEEQYNGWVLA